MESDLISKAFASPPHWAHERIMAFDDDAFRSAQPFVVECYWNGQQSINVFDVVGTSHPDYAGLSWLEFLRTGKRMKLNLALFRDNPVYYLSDEIKMPHMQYISVDDDLLFVGNDGNHRTAIARFFFHELGRTMLHGVSLYRYRTDRRARELAQAATKVIEERGLRIGLSPRQIKLGREDTAGWMRERWKIEFEWMDLTAGTSERLSPDALERRIEELRRRGKWRTLAAKVFFRA